MTDEKGNAIKKYNYSPFGTLVPEGITSPYLGSVRERLHKHFPPSRRNAITYTGREYEPDSGLYFYRARYYDSRVGRFTSKDPMRSVNPYVYVKNNPINYTDPTGMQAAAIAGPGASEVICLLCTGLLTTHCYTICAFRPDYMICVADCLDKGFGQLPGPIGRNCKRLCELSPPPCSE